MGEEFAGPDLAKAIADADLAGAWDDSIVFDGSIVFGGGEHRLRPLPVDYWPSQASSKRQPLKILLTIIVMPCTAGERQVPSR
jgi:hypothetical protein